MTRLLSYLPMSVCLSTAIVLADRGVDGWGWFLLVAVLFYPVGGDCS